MTLLVTSNLRVVFPSLVDVFDSQQSLNGIASGLSSFIIWQAVKQVSPQHFGQKQIFISANGLYFVLSEDHVP